MINVLIIEDEPLAAEKLEQMLNHQHYDVHVLSVCNSVVQTVKWLNSNPHPDLAFFDIQLGDGISFDIFDQVAIRFPVIFTTAYDNFAVKAFKVNSVDYLLKPVDEDELQSAINKYEQLHQPVINSTGIYNAIQSTAKMIIDGKKYKDRFVVNAGEHIRVIKTCDIACFYSEEKSTFLLTGKGKHYSVDHSLNQLEDEINPSFFFRTSRKEVVNLENISDIVNYGSRCKIIVKTDKDTKELIVSRERMKSFKKWLAEEM